MTPNQILEDIRSERRKLVILDGDYNGEIDDQYTLAYTLGCENIEILGVVLTMFNMRTQLSRQVKEEVDKFFGPKVFKTIIPRNVRLAEAPSFVLGLRSYLHFLAR